jgi:hypothetical protein
MTAIAISNGAQIYMTVYTVIADPVSPGIIFGVWTLAFLASTLEVAVDFVIILTESAIINPSNVT